MRLLQYILFVFLTAGISNAQEIKVTGKVTDSQNLPLPGVSIVIKGSANGTQTDLDGNYTLLATIGDTLMFSYVGFETTEEKVTATSTIVDIKLIPASSQLEEIVVAAYGSSKASKSTSYAVSSNRPRRRGRKHRQRRMNKPSRVQVFSTGNALKVRGTNSISGTKQPLYVVDGVPVDSKDIAVIKAIDPAKISKVEVLKNKNETSIYGSKAQHGCILITTHSGNYKVQNDESYREIVENDFKRVKMAPLSTFSIDVDKASYSNIRRMINTGVKVPADAVKIEEMINYFNYQYEQPKNKHPFAIHTEYASTPWNAKTQLVKIGLKGKEIPQHEIPASNLVFLIDVSGSMSNSNKLPLLKKAFKLLVNQLREKDKVSIVVYAGAAGMVLKPTSGANKHEINQALQNLEAGGSTAGGEGIRLAYKIAKENFIKNGNNRVILATDGDFNVGISSDKDMKKLIEEKRKSDVFLTCLGFGMGNYKDSKLETLADTGNGNHAYIDTMQEAQRVLGKEFGGTLYTIAKDVKIQVEFNPGKVQAYRLIGYENRLLADEDFIDDTKDAGELGSGHTVTALYEVIPVGVKSKYVKEIADLKYTSSATNKEYGDELLTVKFRYKKPQEKKSIEMIHVLHTDTKTSTSKDFNFAASVAWFGMKMRGSKYIDNQNVKDIIALAETNKEKDNQGYKAEFIRLMNSYQGL
ncbi:Ca-activated chloride channel family protein [Aquimarina sp. MAR_2010_214]|uniref:VWA domain-containing protein n=1 Tax=Aquimarina sp. MAR_2010_214 TaxID=1250026 RepID=UPI000C711F0D|nr:VWA domain-containing protein [Aquimarina sp. MAR_2010_214]PKV51477.1 Ca-activated chloride channel family protein [Aquimarina sp. MAR_2010_214]